MKLPGPDHPISIEPHPQRVRVMFNGRAVADTTRALVLRETTYKPVYYIPREDADMAAFERTSHSTHCPYKGDASYYSIRVGDSFRRTRSGVTSSRFRRSARFPDGWRSIPAASTRSKRADPLSALHVAAIFRNRLGGKFGQRVRHVFGDRLAVVWRADIETAFRALRRDIRRSRSCRDKNRAGRGSARRACRAAQQRQARASAAPPVIRAAPSPADW